MFGGILQLFPLVKEPLQSVRALLLHGASALPGEHAADGALGGAAHGVRAHAAEGRLLEMHLRLPGQASTRRPRGVHAVGVHAVGAATTKR